MNSYILWDKSAELFSFGSFILKWDGFLLLVAFVVGKQMLGYIYKKEGKPSKDVDLLITYLVVAVFLLSRIGHAIFYEQALWLKPLSILLPFELKPKFHFTGMTGFSSAGGVLGIFIAIWLYSRKKKEDQNFLQTLDRISILSLWIAALILAGSFLNSKIDGKPTNSFLGTVFINPVSKGLLELPCCIIRNPGGKNPLNKVIALKDKKQPSEINTGYKSVAIYLFFKAGTTQRIVDDFLQGDVKSYLYNLSELIYETGTKPLNYTIFTEPNGDIEVRVGTIGVARYPVQLFESISSLLIFLLLFWYWGKHKLKLPPGKIASAGLIGFWSVRFIFEFLKEDQTSFIDGLGLNKGQLLCTPFILAGIVILFISKRKWPTIKNK